MEPREGPEPEELAMDPHGSTGPKKSIGAGRKAGTRREVTDSEGRQGPGGKSRTRKEGTGPEGSIGSFAKTSWDLMDGRIAM